MRSVCIVIGLLTLALALRSSRCAWLRKLGAVAFLAASFALLFFSTGSLYGGLAGAMLWFFLPWVELLTRVRRMRLPMDNRLSHRPSPNPAFFPNARETLTRMEAEGFRHVSDCCWEWAGMKQHFRLYYHGESKTVATLCLCEQSDVVFSFVSLSSMGRDGQVWKTTNYPFAPTLIYPEKFHWNHVPCSQKCFQQILSNHREHLAKAGVESAALMAGDPEHLEEIIEEEMQEMIEHNLDKGIIEFSGEGYFSYSTKGLFYLWGQFIKDMVRLC